MTRTFELTLDMDYETARNLNQMTILDTSWMDGWELTREKYDKRMTELRQAAMGRWGNARLKHLRDWKPEVYREMKSQGGARTPGMLLEHCLEIQTQCLERIESLMNQAKGSDPELSEAAKAADPVKWAGLWNNYLALAEQNAYRELVCD